MQIDNSDKPKGPDAAYEPPEVHAPKTVVNRRLLLKKISYIPPAITLITTSLAPTSAHAS
jgi:hypothetical protein